MFSDTKSVFLFVYRACVDLLSYFQVSIRHLYTVSFSRIITVIARISRSQRSRQHPARRSEKVSSVNSASGTNKTQIPLASTRNGRHTLRQKEKAAWRAELRKQPSAENKQALWGSIHNIQTTNQPITWRAARFGRGCTASTSTSVPCSRSLPWSPSCTKRPSC